MVIPPGGVPRKLPRIVIDHEKCTVPFLCKKCLEVCPEAVFRVHGVAGKQERLKEMDPRIDGNYMLEGYYRNKCTLCNQCVEVCPADALTLIPPSAA